MIGLSVAPNCCAGGYVCCLLRGEDVDGKASPAVTGRLVRG